MRARFDSTYEGLKLEQMWHDLDENTCFDSTYEGLKPFDISLGGTKTPSFDSTYEGLKRSSTDSTAIPRVRFRQYL